MILVGLSSLMQPVRAADKPPERNFYEVLDDLMSDFEYDLKNGNVSGMRDLSIRNVGMSENIPASFKPHLELLVTEKIMKNLKTRMIQCLPCRAKRTTVEGDQLKFSSPETNPTELARIAKLSGIQNFLDIVFSYQPNGLILSMYVSEPESGSIVWSRSYNSETSRASAFRRGVDYSQVDDARKFTEYVPGVQYRLTLYYLFEPNVSKTTGCLGGGLRMMERYDNRKKEVGFEFDYIKDATTLVNSATAGTANLWSGINVTLLFMHSWNFIGDEENFNKVRSNIFIGMGGTYTSGFLGGVGRGGFEWRLGKHFAVSANVGYRPESTVFIPSATGSSVKGVEYGLGIGYLF